MFVCTGNTCRSPMAEGLLKAMAKNEKLEYMDIISTGTGTYDGYPVSNNAAEVSRKAGIDISYHHSTQLVADLMKESDLILALAVNHYDRMQSVYPEYSDKVFMLKGFPEKGNGKKWSVADPIGLDYEQYQQTFYEIKAELERIWPAIKERYKIKIKG